MRPEFGKLRLHDFKPPPWSSLSVLTEMEELGGFSPGEPCSCADVRHGYEGCRRPVGEPLGPLLCDGCRSSLHVD